jgi:NADPH:quinone reductase-like Zn-dependent oxidoreductase
MDGRAWIWNGEMEPNDLELVSYSFPDPQEDEVLVENRAVALNPVDWKMLVSPLAVWEPGHIPGVDGAGIVVETGPGVSIPVGSRVAYFQGLERNGSFATHALVSTKALLSIPPNVSFADAASVPCPGLTAAQAIAKFPSVSGKDILITGGGAATGHYTVQIALGRGFRVWTTASPKHKPLLLRAGVAGTFDYHREDWRDELLHALAGRRLYAAVDTVSDQYARTLAPLIGYNGHLVCIHGRLNSPVTPPFGAAISLHEVALAPIYIHGSDEDWVELRKAGNKLLNSIAEGTMKSFGVVSFSFDELADALASFKSGAQQGKLVAELS